MKRILLGHELGGFTSSVESFNYSQQALKIVFAHPLSAEQLAVRERQRDETSVPLNRQVAIANLLYGKRMGNKAEGDGWKYRGRRLVQVSGLDNYLACGAVPKFDLVVQPEFSERESHAKHSVGWCWQITQLWQVRP